MRYFPAFFDLRDRPCLIVGGGEAAARKLRLLRGAGAAVTIVAPSVTAEIAALADGGRVRWLNRAFRDDDPDGMVLAVAATGLEDVDGAVAGAVRSAGVPVNVVDAPDLSDFAVPAIVDRDPIVIGISTGGASPVLARRIRGLIEAMLPARIGALARLAGEFRGAVAALAPDADVRRRLWERVFDGAVAERALAGDEIGAREALLSVANRRGAVGVTPGRVSILGATEKDSDLVSLRGLHRLQSADWLILMAGAAPALTGMARRDALRRDFGPDDMAGLAQFAESELRSGGHVVVILEEDPAVSPGLPALLRALAERGIAAETVGSAPTQATRERKRA
ncbi:MAG: siroheme synthase [Rhodospirillaceae bacterium]|nr:siroheme synthase [Rhodospirillaceae bacterium]